MKLTLMVFASCMYLSACNNSSANSTADADTSTQNTTTAAEQASPQQDTSGNGLMASMNAMMDKMSSMKMSGDFDMDFANMMIEHHQGAIDMSEQEIKSGSDTKMKDMAQKIITAQKEEISKLQDIVKNGKPAGMKMGEGELEKSMSDMKSKMSSMQMSGNMDRDFAMMMMDHHEEAISMSKMELKNGMNAQLKQMAQKTITDQAKEISEFKAWLSAHK